MKKIAYELVINHGTRIKKPFTYSYGLTKSIELHLRQGAVLLSFQQSVKRDPDMILSIKDRLCSDAIKKTMFIHLMQYGKPLRINTVTLSIDGSTSDVYSNARDNPFIYSMIEENLDHPFPEAFRSAYDLILNMPKSSYDGRINAVIALLLAKAQYYRSEKAFYLWTAMNGYYNYLTNECKKLPGCKNQYRKEFRQQELLGKYIGHDCIANSIDESIKATLFQKGMSLLKRTNLAVDIAYISLQNVQSDFFQAIQNILQVGRAASPSFQMTPYSFMVIWLPYQIRCTYFHANQAMPIFSYEDEPLLTVLQFTNYFVESFLESNLPAWLRTREPSNDQRNALLAADHQV